MEFFEQSIYGGIAFLATAIVFFQTILTFGGIDDLDLDDESHDGTRWLSTRTIAAFFMGFGWAGAVARMHVGGLATAVIAFGVGLLFGAAIWALMRFAHSMRASGTLDYRNAVGATGTVYLPIPSGGFGQVQVVIQGRLTTARATTCADRTIENQESVRVVGHRGTTLVVAPV
jgi:membrane protein implicated in regulation of membrane protease activity